MVWDEETIAHLKELWAQGLSTAEIGRRLGVSKNAIVGKAHRLELDARPSPIRRAAVKPEEQAYSRAAGPTLPPLASTAMQPLTVQVAPVHQVPVHGIMGFAQQKGRPDDAGPGYANPASRLGDGRAVIPAAGGSRRGDMPLARNTLVAGGDSAGPRAVMPSATVQARRSAPSCCWPIGEPGTKTFRFCDDLSVAGKPYCDEHARLAYVRVRDRKDDAA